MAGYSISTTTDNDRNQVKMYFKIYYMMYLRYIDVFKIHYNLRDVLPKNIPYIRFILL